MSGAVAEEKVKRSKVRDMTEGSIVRQILLFSVPLMIGNVFQMMYNTVDSIVVGNFVGKEALAAVGSTSVIVNILVFFFNGFATGAGVVIARHFGARDLKKLHASVETTMAVTFIFCAVFTVVGVLLVNPLLRAISTPDDVFRDASLYLRIYFAGITGLLIYNMGSGILRAVGDTTRPLYFLILTSVLNIILDLLFVIAFKMGVAGVALATVAAQLISAMLTLSLLLRSKDIYRLSLRELHIDGRILKNIAQVGFPAAIQSTITAFSNTFVQGYVNYFGSSVMAGWSCYNKLNQFIMLPMQSTAMASTTFVSQNIGAGKEKRASRGTFVTIAMTEGITALIAALIFAFSGPAIGLFTKDAAVIEAGVLFIHTNIFFLLFNCVNHVLAGALRGRGDAKAPMAIMLICFVGLRQVYLFIVTRFFANTPAAVGFGYPVGWMSCFVIQMTYYYFRWYRKKSITGEDPD